MNGDIWGYAEGRKCRKSVRCIEMPPQLNEWTANSAEGKIHWEFDVNSANLQKYTSF